MKRFVLFLLVAMSPLLMGASGCTGPTAPETRESAISICSRGNLFYCPGQGGPQTPILSDKGYVGYCAGGAGNSTSRGYSGYNSNSFTSAYRTSGEAWSACGSTSATDRGWCFGVITCERE